MSSKPSRSGAPRASRPQFLDHPTPMQDNRTMASSSPVAWIALMFTVVANATTFAYSYGSLGIRVQHLEQSQTEIRADMRGITGLREDMAVTKNQLAAINEQLKAVVLALENRKR